MRYSCAHNWISPLFLLEMVDKLNNNLINNKQLLISKLKLFKSITDPIAVLDFMKKHEPWIANSAVWTDRATTPCDNVT